MNARRATYLDSSAIVKLAAREEASDALKQHIRRRHPVISSALARTEVSRAMLLHGERAIARAAEVFDRIELVRVSDRVLSMAGELLPAEVRSLDAIHLATAQLLGSDLRHVVTYDARMASAAESLGLRVESPR